jgi:phage recombination protein Bet
MSTNLIAQQTNNLAKQFNIPESNELVTVLKNTAFKGDVSDAQMSALLIVANQYGLNPWTREIYAFPDKSNGIVPVVGVDGWSRIINTHPQFDGMDFKQDDESCTCIIYRKDRNHPISCTEYMSECFRPAFTNKYGTEVKGPWQSHPKRMLRHKAMIQCARLAFGYTGIFDQDEAERIVEVDVTPQKSGGRVNNSLQNAEAAREVRVIDPEAEQKREILILELEQTASLKGLTSYGEEWLSLSKEDRVLVGAAEHERLKTMAAARDREVAAEIAAPQELNCAEEKVLSEEVDPFVAAMESVENE